MKEYIKGANPYMPLWEHVPDGEPRVFEYNGEKRVYVYGSHDTARTRYCGRDYVVWSAPVHDLTDWKCHGVCYEATDKSILCAPDVVQKGDTFYLYAAEDINSRIMVAKSKNPAGPFVNPVKTEIGCDPGVLVDDDGSVYAFWGFGGCYCAQLNEDMATIKEGTLHAYPVGNCVMPGWTNWKSEMEHVDHNAGFYEAASPRKINGKYVLVYSRCYNMPLPEYGTDSDCNAFLSYQYSDSPLEGYKPGGDICHNGGEVIRDENGQGRMTYPWGNNHGGLVEVEGKWYIFFHRQTGTNEYSRQAMLEPVDIAMNEDGKIFIGKITYSEGEPISSGPVEMTSQGAHIHGIDAYKIISAGYACHLSCGSMNSYIEPVYEQIDSISACVKNITNGTLIGYRYLQFGEKAPAKVTLKLQAFTDLTVNVRTDEYNGKIAAVLNILKGDSSAEAFLAEKITGKHAMYFEFVCTEDNVAAEFDCFTFD